MPFRIRDAVPSPSDDDAKFITSAFDSSIPHLSSIGSAGQWGTDQLSVARPGFLARHASAIADAEAYRLASSSSSSGAPIKNKPVRVLIAEAALPGRDDGDGAGHEQQRYYLPVGAATLRANYLPQYVLDQEHLQGVTGPLLAGAAGEGGGDFMYLEVLITDFREPARDYRKGAGAALVQYAKEWVGKELGMHAMYVDCWAGNGEKLVRYIISSSSSSSLGTG
ncbi:hypothetical protein MYCTH_2313121 [Thermothelomyces thermophilus ATCC 42464]|uniref:N-acetyltransferase domain-containing protein n=1 Tax=Thermothelomyces thermophilus (strain ATCC 42464 / BCRC 31852 / DSM 1799) TaxID=573729 RepID=G2QNT8_THET4|nr:uncharacterized protein MYCTH_2313121 [Thermothelomyces thermophilus ATCC 42464]AEO62114.1 hypothetical protein MYCTH_2313121 [Thermothelomyces thermophilus ATCC 42464]